MLHSPSFGPLNSLWEFQRHYDIPYICPGGATARLAVVRHSLQCDRGGQARRKVCDQTLQLLGLVFSSIMLIRKWNLSNMKEYACALVLS